MTFLVSTRELFLTVCWPRTMSTTKLQILKLFCLYKPWAEAGCLEVVPCLLWSLCLQKLRAICIYLSDICHT